MAASARPISDLFTSQDWRTLLDVSLTGIHLVRPVYAADGWSIEDFAIEYLNPAAQRMVGLAEQPGGTLLGQFPHARAMGIFAYYQRAFDTGEVLAYETNYQADGLDNYFKFSAQRSGERLLVSFTDTGDQNRSIVEAALRESQAREQSAQAEAEGERRQLREALGQLPAQVATYRGPDHVYEFINARYQAYFPRQAFVGQSIRQALPEAAANGVLNLFDQVYQTGEPYHNGEQEFWLTTHADEQPQQLFLSFTLLPLRDAQGQINGLLDFSYEVTAQVRARQQVQQLNEELSATNGELAALNAEYHLANAALTNAQQELQSLNHELEARVVKRTAQVREQQELVRHILKSVPAAIATLSGPDHRFSFANAQYQHLVGNRAALGQTVAEALPELVEQGIIALLDRVHQTGEPYVGREIALMLEHPPGPPHQHYYDITYLPLHDGQGQAQSILVFAVEVTEQVRTRRQAAALQAELLAASQRQAQERQDLYQVFEQTPAAIVLLREPSHTIDYYNPAFATIFPPEGHAPDALRGRSLAEVYPRMQEAGLVQLLDRVFKTGEPQVVLEMPLAELHPGSPRYVTFAYQAYREQGLIVGVAAFVYDATDQVLARQQVLDLNEELAATNEELQQSNARLTRTNTDLDTFVYTASHDLKAPITNIEGLLLALRHDLPAGVLRDTTVLRLLDMMQNSVVRFQQTIGHLTHIAELQQPEATETVNLPALIQGVRLDLAFLIEAAPAGLTVDTDGCDAVRVAPKTLRSVVYNLLSNAIKYRAPDRPAQVALRARCAPGQLVLTVQDNGLGLTEAQQGQLFGMFRRLHTHVEGSGVGLFMVKRLIENVGGTIAVQSQPGVGSTFTVSLPA